ncbi:MAG TPA: flagellar hook-basal body complex protein FliE [Candidatus Sulfotelmatobacter sp.]|nr:flagellar hook-basal body complex protein FliE [Candidatus Sulfotelmatobacter sp.]HWI57205.1 flagellar hook-basal body complex protein FliE [Bacillota bacterium]
MLPLSAIPSSLSTYGLTPRAEAALPDLATKPTPGVEGLRPMGPASEVGPSQPTGESFGNVLGRMVEEINTRQGVAADAVSALQSGQNVSLHQAMIAMEEANVSFQLMVEVRNKLLESYQELMRMQI